MSNGCQLAVVKWLSDDSCQNRQTSNGSSNWDACQRYMYMACDKCQTDVEVKLMSIGYLLATVEWMTVGTFRMMVT